MSGLAARSREGEPPGAGGVCPSLHFVFKQLCVFLMS